jgi:hypothetical protein
MNAKVPGFIMADSASIWRRMFCNVQEIVCTSSSIISGVRQAISLGRAEYGDQAFWDGVQNEVLRLPLGDIVAWAREGLTRLPYTDSCEPLVLDLGDTPEIFDLMAFRNPEVFAEDKLRQLILSECVISGAEFAKCTQAEDNGLRWPRWPDDHLAYHKLVELNNSTLNEVYDSSGDHSESSYFLWITIGSLALIEPFRDAGICKQVMKGRDKLYLLSGFEEIFTYLATVTANGLLFESSMSPRCRDRQQPKIYPLFGSMLH